MNCIENNQSSLNPSVCFHTNLLGMANVYNVVAAIGCVHHLGFSMSDLIFPVEKLTPLSGRMQVVYQKEFTVIIDYAHTVDAFKQLADFVREMDGRRVIVMGLGGDRDATKRPLIGKVIYDSFDVMVLTSDNPRSEDPLRIIADVCALVGYDKAIIEVNRKSAIQLAIQRAEVGDIIVIAGRGNEQYQQIGDVRLRFVDEEIIKEALGQRCL